MDHKYVKYQSLFNSSWFIGFNTAGNSISGPDTTKRDNSNTSLKRERCYQFTKLNRLTTTAQVFPEVIPMIQQAEDKALYPGPTLEALAILKAKLQPAQPAKVHSFNQKQLINMTRFRNILRYLLGRTQEQPLVANETSQQLYNISSTQTVDKNKTSLIQTTTVSCC